MTRVFLDANVLFSTANPDSNISKLIQLLITKAEPITCDYALEEAKRNINLKRPQWTDHFNTLITQITIAPSIVFKLPVEIQPKDQPILCTAIRTQCQVLATGDKRDFDHLYNQTILGTTIISLSTLAQLLIKT